MTLLPKDPHGTPFLLLAPMEGVGDRAFRRAIASVGGFDEAVREFIRVPQNPHFKSLARDYDPDELAPIPLVPQLMGADPELMAEMAREIERCGAKRIDLNCGCPSNTVTGRGAGSSLLKEPDHLYKVGKAMVEAVQVPVTIKMRSGFADIALFRENVLAAEASGVAFITLHPRTKVDGYGPPARWDLIAQAKSLLSIPLVGNGDILTVEDAIRCQRETGCDALMIGRGSIINPFIFHQIKAHFAGKPFAADWSILARYFAVFVAHLEEDMSVRGKISKMKQLCGFFFQSNSHLQSLRKAMLSHPYTDLDSFLQFNLPLMEESWHHFLELS